METSEISHPSTEITTLREIVSEAYITSTAPLSAYDIMSGEQLWETTEALTIQANNYQVLLDNQVHTELILTVPDDELITVNGTDYPNGLIIRAQENELYVIHYLSQDQITAQSDIFSPADSTINQLEPPHQWYDLDDHLPESPPQIARHRSP